MKHELPELTTLNQAASEIGISRRTARRRMDAGELIPTFKAGRTFLFLPARLASLRRSNPPATPQS